jgi:hypothetical protein
MLYMMQEDLMATIEETTQLLSQEIDVIAATSNKEHEFLIIESIKGHLTHNVLATTFFNLLNKGEGAKELIIQFLTRPPELFTSENYEDLGYFLTSILAENQDCGSKIWLSYLEKAPTQMDLVSMLPNIIMRAAENPEAYVKIIPVLLEMTAENFSLLQASLNDICRHNHEV